MAADKKTIIKMAYIYFQEGRWDKALEEYRKLLELDPNDVATQSMVADVYDKKGETRLALHGYLKVLDNYMKTGAPDKALVIRKKVALLKPDTFDNEEKKRHAVVKMTLEADRAFEKGDVDQALPLFEQLARLDQDNLQARSQLADLYSKKGMVDDAVRELMTVGLACAKGRLLNRAQECFQRVLTYKPDHHEARGHLAEIYLRRGSENEAKKEFLNLAQALVDQGEVDRAIPPAQKALQLKSIEAHYVLGLIYYKRGNFAEAERSFQEILRFKVGHVSALVHLAQVKAAQGDLDGALAGMGRAVSAEPENPTHLEVLAEYYLKKGSNKDAAGNYLQAADLYIKQRLLDKAQEVLQRIIGLDPKDKTALQRLAEVLIQRGMKPEASKVMERVGDLFSEAGPPKPAQDAYTKARELDPANSSASGKLSSFSAAMAGPPKSAPAAPPPPPPVAAPKASPPVFAPPAPPSAAAKPAMENPFRVGAPLAAPTPAPVPVAAPISSPVAPPLQSPAPPVVAPLNQDVIRWTTMADIYAEKGLLDEALANYQKAQQADPQDAEIAAKVAKVVQQLTKKAQDEARAQAEAEVRRKLEDDAKKKTQAEARRIAEEDIRKKEEAKRRAEEEEVRRKAEAEARQYAEEAAKKKAAEEARKAREAEEQQKRAEDQARKMAEEMVRKREDESRKKAEEESRLKAELERRRLADAEQEKRQAEILAKKLQEDADRKKSAPAPFLAPPKISPPVLDEEAGRKAEALAAKKLLEENKRKAQEEDRKKEMAAKKGPAPAPSRAQPASQAGASGDDLDDEEYMTVSVAEIYRRRGQLGKSEKILTKILEKAPNHVEARRKLDELLAIKRRSRPVGLKPAGSPPPALAAEPAPAPDLAPAPPPPPAPGPAVPARPKKSRISYV